MRAIQVPTDALGWDEPAGARAYPWVDLLEPLAPAGVVFRLVGWRHYAVGVPDGGLWRLTLHWPDGSHQDAGRWPRGEAIGRARMWLRLQAMYLSDPGGQRPGNAHLWGGQREPRF